mmetsp:Transcript_7374/g.25265  ORF Transcript_7374/g.25265 Transcript_7374/m.25265 type:complete len:90 (-) Transcript_7374:134-403(-)
MTDALQHELFAVLWNSRNNDRYLLPVLAVASSAISDLEHMQDLYIRFDISNASSASVMHSWLIKASPKNSHALGDVGCWLRIILNSSTS